MGFSAPFWVWKVFLIPLLMFVAYNADNPTVFIAYALGVLWWYFDDFRRKDRAEHEEDVPTGQ